MKQQQFYRMVWSIALPVTLQSMLQSSFSVVDQLMIGQLGSVSIAGVGLGGKFASIYSVLISAVAAVAGILMAQYLGRGEHRQASSAFFSNLLLGCGLAVLFTVVCLVAPQRIMAAYTTDAETRMAAASYLRILSLSFLPAAVTSVLAALLRCAGAAALPLYASLLASGANTVLNNLLIFGRVGLPALGVQGAAWASVTAQYLGCAASLILWRASPKRELRLEPVCRLTAEGWRQYWGILAPMLACELLWSLGENVYAMIYGRLGTAACAAMTLTNPVQMLMTGALSGVSQAAGVLIGRTLGEGDMTRAYRDSKRLLALGLGGSVALCLLLTAVRGRYVAFYQVEEPVHLLAAQILLAYALVAPIKVLNMILGGGILRSGGRTAAVMWVDLIGTWGIGVPLGLAAAFWWHLPIPQVYFLLSIEEGVRLMLSFWIFRRRKWMNRLERQSA